MYSYYKLILNFTRVFKYNKKYVIIECDYYTVNH